MCYNKLDLKQLVVLDASISSRNVEPATGHLILSEAPTRCALVRRHGHFEDELFLKDHFSCLASIKPALAAKRFGSLLAMRHLHGRHD